MRRHPIQLLVVDDNAPVRASLSEFFAEHRDFDVVADAENGEEAARLCTLHEPDCVLMDVRMPVMGGIETTRWIKHERPATVVVLITAYEQDELKDAARDAGADAFLCKGTLGSDLIERVREACLPRAADWSQLCAC